MGSGTILEKHWSFSDWKIFGATHMNNVGGVELDGDWSLGFGASSHIVYVTSRLCYRSCKVSQTPRFDPYIRTCAHVSVLSDLFASSHAHPTLQKSCSS